MTEGVTSLKNGVSSQEMYLSEFKISNCGEPHQQEWAKLNMRKFHDSMKLRISLCQDSIACVIVLTIMMIIGLLLLSL